jgi:hypothetical protein
MHCADEAARTTAHHAQSQTASRFSVTLYFQAHGMILSSQLSAFSLSALRFSVSAES